MTACRRNTPVPVATRVRGLTLVELLVVTAMVAVVAVIATPLYREHVREQELRSARTDIKQLEVRIERFFRENRRFPDTLAELGTGPALDPWQRPFEYLNIAAGGAGIDRTRRRKESRVPVNSDYDLYSRGPDGATDPPLNSRRGRDDIVRAADGAWVGIAADY